MSSPPYVDTCFSKALAKSSGHEKIVCEEVTRANLLFSLEFPDKPFSFLRFQDNFVHLISCPSQNNIIHRKILKSVL